jgi:rhodanese-related sulfurtransferase
MAELTIEQAGALAPLVTASEGAERVAAGAVLIDVRSETGRQTGGELLGAIVVGKDEVASKLSVDSPDRIAAVDSTTTPVVVVCGSVHGSGPVAAQLIAWGYSNVVHVEGGFPAWKAAGLPTGAPATGEVAAAGVGPAR